MKEPWAVALALVLRGGQSELRPGVWLEPFDKELISRSVSLVADEFLVDFLRALRSAIRTSIRETNVDPLINNRVSVLRETVDDLTEFIEATETKTVLQEVHPPFEYLTAQETCAMLGISAATLWRWRQEGKIESVGAGRRLRFERKSVERLLRGC